MEAVKLSLAIFLCLYSTDVAVKAPYKPLLVPHAEIQCLARAMEEEAWTEGKQGMRLVANVVIERSKRSGKAICDVLRQPKQFSFVKPSTQLVARFKASEAHARELLVNLVLGKHVDNLRATHFVTADRYETIAWQMPVLLRYKNHVFMREGD